jgi:hypothetical protein
MEGAVISGKITGDFTTMSIFSMKDSNGVKSMTLTLVALPLLSISAVFILSAYRGIDPNYFEFSSSAALLISTWIGRKAVSVWESKAGTLTANESKT